MSDLVALGWIGAAVGVEEKAILLVMSLAR